MYNYDTLGKMVDVQQGVQHRYFMHDSLGRLLRVRQPEQEVNSNLNTSGNPSNNSWTAGFTYDNNGNVLTGIDAIGTTITNTYDAVNRVTQRSYNDSPQTPTVNFYYDGAGLPSVPAYSKGQLTKVKSSVSESRYTEFDVAGRLKEFKQITDGQTYTSKYTYNLSGALIEEEYPSGRVVKNVLDNNGDLSIVQSRKSSNHGFWNYASHFSYNAAGAVTKMQMGNGLWETAQFNARLQSTQLGLGTIPTGASLWKVDYEFGELQTNGAVDATKNNGNIGKQTLTVPGTNSVQSYKYDSLHRLTEAVEKTDTTTNWSQEFEYDRYGNRIGIDQAIGLLTLNTTPTIDTNTNRFNPSQGFSYDKNGNVVNDVDPISSLTRQFIFNGDNKQVEVKKDGITIGRYYYDGEGKRVKKVTDTETTVFVYSSGKLIAEYSTQLSTTPSVAYTTTDHLGTPRIITDELGQVSSRRDFMPFGEELYTGVGGRTGDAGLKYSSSEDEVRQKFTGYQKDDETNLDFAENRMYANEMGRFTAVDPLLASGKSSDPQSFNRYIYVMNNPMTFIDPDGLCTVPTGLKQGQVGICFEAFIAAERIGPGGIGHGDGRSFNGDNNQLTARIMIHAIISTDAEKVYYNYQGKIEESKVGTDFKLMNGVNWSGPDGTQFRIEPSAGAVVAFEGSGSVDVSLSNMQKVQGETNFGEGVDVTLSIANGMNGVQRKGQEIEATGKQTANVVMIGLGKAIGAALPGTIDGDVTLRVSGNENVQGVSANGRPFPSFAAYSYTKDANGNVTTKVHLEQRETSVENLTKPIQPFRVMP